MRVRRPDGGQRQDRGIAYDSEERETRSTSDDRPCCITRKRTGNSDIRANVLMQRFSHLQVTKAVSCITWN